MKLSRILCVLAGCALLSVPAFAQYNYQPQAGRWYAKIDAGGNWTADTDLKEFFGPVPGGTKVKFDPGFRLGLGVGYELCDYFALEAETGVMENNVDAVTGGHVDAVFANVPFLINAKLQFKNETPFMPYVGAGAGGSFSLLDVDYLRLGDTYMEGSESDVVFAWQAFAGVRYALNDQMGLSLEYRFFWADSPDYEADVTFNTFSNRMSLGRTETHAISLAFDFHF